MKAMMLATLFIFISCTQPQGFDNKEKIVESFGTSLEQKYKNIPFISPKDINEDFLIVDLRDKDNFDVSHIPGAIHFQSFLEFTPEPNQKVVIYDIIGTRSTESYSDLLKKAPSQMMILKSGLLGWIHAGNDLIDDKNNKTSKVLIKDDAWDILPKNYERIEEMPK